MEGKSLGHIAPPGALKLQGEWRSLSTDYLRRRHGLALQRAKALHTRCGPGKQLEMVPIAGALARRGNLN